MWVFLNWEPFKLAIDFSKKTQHFKGTVTENVVYYFMILIELRERAGWVLGSLDCTKLFY